MINGGWALLYSLIVVRVRPFHMKKTLLKTGVISLSTQGTKGANCFGFASKSETDLV